jgi:hypothetical protein
MIYITCDNTVFRLLDAKVEIPVESGCKVSKKLYKPVRLICFADTVKDSGNHQEFLSGQSLLQALEALEAQYPCQAVDQRPLTLPS